MKKKNAKLLLDYILNNLYISSLLVFYFICSFFPHLFDFMPKLSLFWRAFTVRLSDKLETLLLVFN